MVKLLRYKQQLKSFNVSQSGDYFLISLGDLWRVCVRVSTRDKRMTFTNAACPSGSAVRLLSLIYSMHTAALSYH